MQIIEEEAMLHKRIYTGLCVECVLRHHDYKEILPHGRGGDPVSEAPLPAAWIDGRRHRLLIPVGTQGAMCSDCNRRVHGIYVAIAE